MINPISSQQDLRPLIVFGQRSAAMGLLGWFVLLFTTTSDSHETELIHKIVFYAFLVIVPLALSLVPAGDRRGNLRLYRLIMLGQPVAAIITIASFFVEKGLLSAAISVAWFILTALIALFGLTRLVARRFYPLEELSIDAGLSYLPVAGAWLMVYRLGVQPFDYGETIILLTVIHFHFAGFATPIIAGLIGRMLAARQQSQPSKTFLLIVVALVAAMPLIAAGITFSPWLGLIGTLLLTTGLVLLAVLTLTRGWRAIAPTSARLLLVLAALSSCVAMVLACLYAYSIVTYTLIIRIPTMAMTHGLLNAFGFVTCSLIAWAIISARHSVYLGEPRG
ncbi:MAG TPA: YndJ family protein [Pyrinomonadaceae bacterium]|nr:YndJ family protein [Pyrinomonadaceae bacterium]